MDPSAGQVEGPGLASARRSRPARNATLDYARLVAAFGIVLFHLGSPGAQVGYAALPFFLIVLIVMALPSAMRSSPADYVRSRARRLLVPWLVWSAIYLALKLIEIGLAGHSIGSELAPWMLLTGPAIHLWFLPFAFVASLALLPLVAFVRPSGGEGPRARRAAAILALGVAATAAMVLSQRELAPPLAQWSLALPAVLLGLALALAGSGRNGLSPEAVLLGVPVLAGAWWMGWTNNLPQIALALGMLAACLAFRLPEGPLSRRAAEMSLVVYLCHPAAASVIERIGLAETGTLALAVLTMILSLALALAWGRSDRLLAWSRRRLLHG